MAATKLRSSSMNLHGVFHKSRVFDPTCLFEATAKPMIQQKCLFDSDIVNYADVENLYRTIKIIYVSTQPNFGASQRMHFRLSVHTFIRVKEIPIVSRRGIITDVAPTYYSKDYSSWIIAQILSLATWPATRTIMIPWPAQYLLTPAPAFSTRAIPLRATISTVVSTGVSTMMSPPWA